MSLSAAEMLNREFLEVRARILEIASALDRIDRAEGDVTDDPRVARLRQGLTALDARPERAERVQLIFSRPYDEQWQETLAMRETRNAELKRDGGKSQISNLKVKDDQTQAKATKN